MRQTAISVQARKGQRFLFPAKQAASMELDRLLRISAVADQRCASRRSQWLRNAHAHDVAEVRRRKRRQYQQLQEQAASAQQHFHNREIASTADFEFRPPSENTPAIASRIGAPGRWKQRTATEVLRVAFAEPSTPARTIGRSLRPPASGKYCSDLQSAVSQIVLAKQASAIDATCRQPLEFLVLSLTFDESKFFLHSPGELQNAHMASEACVFASHGRLVWGILKCTGLEVEEEEFALKPVAMATNSAAAMWASLRQVLPASLISLIEGKSPCKSVAICPVCDSASANAMLVTHMENKADDSSFVLPGWCMQHKTGNALQPTLTELGLLPPMYCLTRRMRDGTYQKRFLQGLRLGIAQNLHWVRGSEQPGWQPNAEHQQHAEHVLELAYYRKDLRNSEDPEELDAHGDGGGERLRRERGQELLALCPGDWRRRSVVVWDRQNKFSNPDEVVEHVFQLLLLVGFHCLGTPAANKWLSLWPLASSFLMMMSFHGIFLFAMRHACRVAVGEEAEMEAVSESELLGHEPTNEAWHRRERRRELKALAWAEGRDGHFSTALFTFVGQHAIRLHFLFFKHGDSAPYGPEKSLLFKLCSPTSPVRQAVGSLWQLLQYDQQWGSHGQLVRGILYMASAVPNVGDPMQIVPGRGN